MFQLCTSAGKGVIATGYEPGWGELLSLLPELRGPRGFVGSERPIAGFGHYRSFGRLYAFVTLKLQSDLTFRLSLSLSCQAAFCFSSECFR